MKCSSLSASSVVAKQFPRSPLSRGVQHRLTRTLPQSNFKGSKLEGGFGPRPHVRDPSASTLSQPPNDRTVLHHEVDFSQRFDVVDRARWHCDDIRK
jgi:hypothetical protein